jgi:hypothetical protein
MFLVAIRGGQDLISDPVGYNAIFVQEISTVVYVVTDPIVKSLWIGL